jgi:eukaryotic-like serine/threonine-protein kinase
MGDPESEIKQRAVARVGSVLRDKWRLDELLGLGGMAAVYAGTHRNGKLGAIKVLHPEAALVPDVKARFLREGYLANKVQHPGAVSILDDDIDLDGTVFLVMELLEGETLDTRWNREKLLDWKQVFVIADRVLDVLVAAHRKEIVHRDLKPGNVFICLDGAVKILDFGIARLQTIAPAIGDTGGHISLGTPGFMPPEQARGQWSRVDPQSDVWSLGATMFAVLTDRYVHEAETVNEQLLAAMTEPAPPIAQILPNIPPEAAKVVDRALVFDKQGRFPSALAMQEALRSAYETLCDAPLASASRLEVPGVQRLRSVLPDAPTVAAADLESLRLSTSRPVSTRRETLAREQSRRDARRKWAIIGGGIGVAVLGTWLLVRSSPREMEGSPVPSAATQTEARQAAEHTPPAAPVPAIPAEPAISAEHAGGVPNGAAPREKGHRPKATQVTAAPSPSAAAAGATTAAAGPEASAVNPAGSTSTAPAVDIFTRRK